MRRKSKFYRIIICFFVMLCGCNNQRTVVEDVNYTLFEEDDNNTSIEGKEDLQKEDNHNNEEGTNHTSVQSDAMDHVEGDSNEENEAAMIELKNLAESMNFNGVEGEFIVKSTGNSFENHKGFSEFSYLVCYDDKNQCTYYINYGIDDYIYQRKDNTTTLLIKEKARYLQLWNNKLYFVNATGMFHTGDVYCYDLDSKNLTKVIIGEIGSLYVNEEGMIFSEYEISKDQSATSDMRMLYHDSSADIDCNVYNLYEYKDFILQFNENSDSVELMNRNSGEMSPLFSYEYVTNYRVYNSYVIINKSDVFLVIDLLTGDKMIYDVTQCNLPSKRFTVMDYIVKENILYVVPSIKDYMIIVDLEKDTMQFIQNTQISKQTMDKLYIAGDKMYAYLDMFREEEASFTELILSDCNYHFE